MPVRFFGLRNCDTCRKAARAMRESGLEVEERCVRADGVPRQLLEQALEAVGSDRLVNRQSRTWKGLAPGQRDAAPLDLLLAHPALIKRPLIFCERSGILVGWNDDTRAALKIAGE